MGAASLSLGAATLVGAATVPVFYLLEPFPPGGFLVHFDTEENRRYELQARSDWAGTDLAAEGWHTLYVAESFPFANHYIVLDPVTNSSVRLYRLIATP